MNRFWNWVRNEDGRTLYLDGVIAEESWFDDEITPAAFRSELMAGDGEITVWRPLRSTVCSWIIRVM